MEQAMGSTDVTIDMTSSASTILTGDDIFYTLMIKNSGTWPATHLVVKSELPSELVRGSYSADGGITWARWQGRYIISSLAGGQTMKIIIKGSATCDAAGCTCNVATVSSPIATVKISSNKVCISTTILPAGKCYV